MRITKLTVKDFRGIPEATIELHPKMNVLVGVNGAGKSAILDCLAILLSRASYKVVNLNSRGLQFDDDDISNSEPSVFCVISVDHEGTLHHWSILHRRNGQKSSSDGPLFSADAHSLALRLRPSDEAGNGISIPLLTKYPVNRAALDIPLRVRKHQKSDWRVLIAKDLNKGNFRDFFEWFRDREDIENEAIRDIRASQTPSIFDEPGGKSNDATYPDPQLQAVRSAIYAFIPSFSELKVQRRPRLRMVVNKDGLKLAVNQLSDGEKDLLSMVGDIARKLAILNPQSSEPLNGAGIVLIDEIELHLHPSWQRMVVPALERTFPNCQFILTTHSPQVLSQVEHEKIFILDREEGRFSITKPDASFGWTSNRILQDIFGEPERPVRIKEAISKLFLLIERKKYEEAANALRAIREGSNEDPVMQGIGEDPELLRAAILLTGKVAVKS